MNTMLPFLILALLAFSWGCLAFLLVARAKRRGEVTAINIGEGSHAGALTLLATAPISSGVDDRVCLLGKFGADNRHVTVAGAADISIGWINDEAELAEDPVVVELHGTSTQTKKALASGVIALGAFVVGDAGGKVKTLPVAAGTYYIVGRALAAAAADEDIIEVDPIPVTQRVVA